MTVSSIVDCLIAGKELSDIIMDREGVLPGSDKTRYSPPVQDTSKYLLYRIRRLGYALGMLGDRVLKAARTEDAISYRLMHDPMGPLQLADALIREHEASSPAEGEVEALVFALCEIMLIVAHAGANCHAEREAGEPDLRKTCFGACVQALKNKVQTIKDKTCVDDAILKYRKQIYQKTNMLIGQRKNTCQSNGHSHTIQLG